MGHFQESIEINAPISSCFQEWSKFEQFPRFMKHVQSVTPQVNDLWHWIVDGPLGSKVEWDAKMDARDLNRAISWHTVSGQSVDTQGSILFQELSPNQTRITSSITYEPPAGVAGEIVAKIFSNPQQMVKDDLNNFKQLLEGNNSQLELEPERESIPTL